MFVFLPSLPSLYNVPSFPPSYLSVSLFISFSHLLTENGIRFGKETRTGTWFEHGIPCWVEACHWLTTFWQGGTKHTLDALGSLIIQGCQTRGKFATQSERLICLPFVCWTVMRCTHPFQSCLDDSIKKGWSERETKNLLARRLLHVMFSHALPLFALYL